MNVVFTGSLRYQLQLSEVLRRIMESKAQGMTALLLLDEENGRRGNIYISNSLYVCGADLTNAEGPICTGYEALKILCSLVLADFKYVQGPEHYFEKADVSLNIEIPQIIRFAPRLPNEPPAVQSESALMDRIFSPEVTLEPAVSSPPIHAAKPIQFAQSLSRTDWKAIVGSKKEAKKEVRQEVKYTSLEERASAEIDPQTVSGKPPRRKSFIEKIAHSIKFSMLSNVTAFGHLFKKLAWPVLIPALVIVVGYQIYHLFGAQLMHLQLPHPSFPGTKHHSAGHSH